MLRMRVPLLLAEKRWVVAVGGCIAVVEWRFVMISMWRIVLGFQSAVLCLANIQAIEL